MLWVSVKGEFYRQQNAVIGFAVLMGRVDLPAYYSGYIGTNSFSVLSNAFKSPHHHIRLGAVAGTGGLASEAEPALDKLLACLSDPDLNVRKAAAITVGHMGNSHRG